MIESRATGRRTEVAVDTTFALELTRSNKSRDGLGPEVSADHVSLGFAQALTLNTDTSDNISSGT